MFLQVLSYSLFWVRLKYSSFRSYIWYFWHVALYANMLYILLVCILFFFIPLPLKELYISMCRINNNGKSYTTLIIYIYALDVIIVYLAYNLNQYNKQLHLIMTTYYYFKSFGFFMIKEIWSHYKRISNKFYVQETGNA